jgi:hypothetical protein
MKYSKDLIIKLQEYFREHYGVGVKEEKADQYLDVIADFYITLVGD